MCQRRIGDLAREIRLLCRPVAKCRTEPVRRDLALEAPFLDQLHRRIGVNIFSKNPGLFFLLPAAPRQRAKHTHRPS